MDAGCGRGIVAAAPAPKINLKQEQAKLDSAIENASKQVLDDPRKISNAECGGHCCKVNQPAFKSL